MKANIAVKITENGKTVMEKKDKREIKEILPEIDQEIVKNQKK